MTGKVLGIDLGTTNSVVAIANGREARVLADSEGRRLIPSVVSFHPDGSILVGHEARERRLVDAKNTVYSTKRLIGRPFSSSEVQKAKERFAFDLEATKVGGVQVRVRRGTFALPEISAMVLRHLRRVAEDSLGEPCGRAVVTVPANFNELQRSATQAAGKVAGLDVLRILNEPTAATLAYGLSREKAEKVAVYDLGGGTFDITILDLDKDVFEVVSTAGDTFLGGDDIDLAIAEKMADACLRQHRFDARADSQAFERMRAAAEWAKCQLSGVKEVDVTLEELFSDGSGKTVDYTFHITRKELEALIHPLIARTFDVVNDALRAAGRRPKEVDSVVLVGGSTRIPMVRAMVDEFFGKPARIDIDPDLVVAQGAAIHGFTIAGEKPAADKGKALARVALKKVTKPITAIKEERIPRQQAFAPEEGRDDKQARVVDDGDVQGLPPLARPPTSPGVKAPAPMSPLARAAQGIEGGQKKPSQTGLPAVRPKTQPPVPPPPGAHLGNDFEVADEPTQVGARPDLQKLLAREAEERAKQATKLAARPGARRGGTFPGGSSQTIPQIGGPVPEETTASAMLSPRIPRQDPAPVPEETTASASLEPRVPRGDETPKSVPEETTASAMLASTPGRVDPPRPPQRDVPSAPVAVIRSVGVVGVGAKPPPRPSDDDAFDAQPTRISEPPKAPADRPRKATLLGALPDSAGAFGERPPPAPPSRPVDQPLDLPSAAFRVDDIDPELAETLREAEAELSKPLKKQAPREATKPFRTGTGAELPLPGAQPPEAAPRPVQHTQPLGGAAQLPPPAAPAFGQPLPPIAPQAQPQTFGQQAFGQQPQGFAPQPQGFAPQPQGFAPQPQGFAPQPQGFAPQPQGFAPQPPTAPVPSAAPRPQPAPQPAPQQLAPRQPVVSMPQRAAPLLMDVTPLSLGIETAGGYCQQIVHRNAPIPTESSRVFATARDGQTEVELKICQGESNRFDENQALGVLMIGPLRQAKRGDVRIEITFMIDQNGILDVKATDMDAQRAQAIRIALRGGVDVAEVDAMRQRQESLFGG
jgi:molecular chaperone DnaK